MDQILYRIQTTENRYKNILAATPYSLKARRTVFLHRRSCNNFVALHEDVFEKLVSGTDIFLDFSNRLIRVFEIQLH